MFSINKPKAALVFFIGSTLSIGLFWFYCKLEIESNIHRVLNNQDGSTVKFTYENLKVSGFPFWVELNFWHPKIQIGEEVNLSLASGGLVVSAPLWSLYQPKFQFIGKQRIYYQHADEKWVLEFKPPGLSGSFRFVEDKLTQLKMIMGNLNLFDTIQQKAVKAKKIEFEFRRDNEPIYNINMKIHGLDMQNFSNSLFKSKIKILSFMGKIQGELPKKVNSAEIAKWRDRGGVVEIIALKLDMNELKVSSKGTLALEREFQPIGAFSVNITNIDHALGSLKAKGLIKTKDIFLIKLFLSGVSKEAAKSETDSLEVPLTIQNNSIYIGPFRIFRWQKLRWVD